MLSSKSLTALTFLTSILFVPVFSLKSGESVVTLRRLTSTSEDTINLNPSLSGDGRVVVFESTADLGHTGSGVGFHALQTDLQAQPTAFSEIARTRVVAPAISQDGSAIAFSSTEDLVGRNGDHNSEIFLLTNNVLKQISDTHANTVADRVTEGSFQPSITDDTHFIVFSSNRNLAGVNADLNSEVFLYDVRSGMLSQLTDSVAVAAATARISGDGSKVLIFRETSATNRDLLLYDRSSTTTQTIVANAPGLAITYGRAISDNGMRVVYARETAENQTQVFLFDAAGNTSRQLTTLGTRVSDVPLHPTISGDGKRIAFATRRRVTAASDGSVELYLYDVPTAQFTQLTDAPPTATAEVVSSLSDDGSTAVFSFPRVLSGNVTDDELANDSEIYVANLPPRPAFASLRVFNAASMGKEPSLPTTLPRGGMAVGSGNALSTETLNASRLDDRTFPLSVGGTTVTVGGVAAQVLYVSPAEVNFVVPAESPVGPADVVVTNLDGFQSRSTVLIADTAPGIFTVTGDGRGEGVALDADKLLPGPFDPSSGRCRLTLFTTGVRNATNISATIAGHNATIEAVLPSPDLPGLDEIHILIPADLRGAGTVTLMIDADGRQSNTVTIPVTTSSGSELVLNEILSDPPDGIAGDANHDGTRSSADDEFIEIVNATTRDFDLSGYQLQTRGASGTTDIVRHRFAAGTIMSAGTSIVVFGGGNVAPLDPAFAGATIFKASTGSLSLVNSGASVTLRDASGAVASSFTYGSTVGLPGDANQSLTRSPDITGHFVLHQLAPGSEQRMFSPGTRLNGSPFAPLSAISQITVMPLTTNLTVGERLTFLAHAFDHNGQELSGVIFRWSSSDTSVATIDSSGTATAVGGGTAMIVASARGVASMPSLVLKRLFYEWIWIGLISNRPA